MKEHAAVIHGAFKHRGDLQIEVHRKKRARESHLVSHLQSVTLHGILAHQARIAVLDEILVGAVRNPAFDNQSLKPHWIDGELGEAGHRFFAEVPAEKRERGHGDNPGDAIEGGELFGRQGLRQGDLVAHDDPQRRRFGFGRDGEFPFEREQRDQ